MAWNDQQHIERQEKVGKIVKKVSTPILNLIFLPLAGISFLMAIIATITILPGLIFGIVPGIIAAILMIVFMFVSVGCLMFCPAGNKIVNAMEDAKIEVEAKKQAKIAAKVKEFSEESVWG